MVIKTVHYVFSIFLLLFISFIEVFANENYLYTYKGNTISGNKAGSTNTAIIELEDENGNKYNTYCLDYNYRVVLDHNYSIVNVSDASFIDKDTTDILRNIVAKSYPYITIEEVSEVSKIEDITVESAISATQAIIWYYVNGYRFILDEKAQELYDFYKSLEKSTTIPAEIDELDIKYETYFEEGERNILITVENKNIFDLEYDFEEDIESIYGVTMKKIDNGVIVQNVPDDIEFNVIVNGKQKINKDVYYYYPEGGRSGSQSLIGVTSGIIEVASREHIKIEEAYYQVKINKKDSLTTESIAGAKFVISNHHDFKQILYEGTTDENGTLIFENIQPGTWYIKETLVPDGYWLDEEIIKIVVKEKDINLDVTNDPTGSLIIRKIDSGNGKILSGAVIGIYKGEQCKELFKEVTTTSKELLIDIPIGNYCIKEIEAPKGYILNIDNHNVEIKEGETSELEFYNHRIYKTALNTSDKSNDIMIVTLLLLGTFFTLCLWYKKCLTR